MTKSTIQSFDDDKEEGEEEKEDRRSQKESDVDKENECRSVNEFNDVNVVKNEPSNSRTEGVALISANILSTQEASNKSLNR